MNYTLVDKNKIERIISLFGLKDTKIKLGLLYVYYSYVSDISSDHFCLPDQYNHFRIKITFSSFSSQKLKIFEQNCVSRENLDDFSEQ